LSQFDRNARAGGFNEEQLGLIETAAFLHDLGKLAIPSEIIEKRGKLTADEWFIMRSHAYYTHKVLDEIDIFRVINSWASLHQERLNGSGYPFGRKNGESPMGARIITIADIFTALTEDRPYRAGMARASAGNFQETGGTGGYRPKSFHLNAR